MTASDTFAASRYAKYLSFSPTGSPFSVRGYVALVQDSWEVSPSGLKQARAYYQFVFFQNRWVESFHQECAKHITQLVLDSNLGIPIFVLKVDCGPGEADLLWHEQTRCVELRSPEGLDQLLRGLVRVASRFPPPELPRCSCGFREPRSHRNFV
ncbi:hypothetical protein PybrP1_003629 [[Pythium] brassicae (nom. inval.)]|nr:hypothetical protein PybrP1_003629 [[Pythium] brassicae (nom. inval.)]